MMQAQNPMPPGSYKVRGWLGCVFGLKYPSFFFERGITNGYNLFVEVAEMVSCSFGFFLLVGLLEYLLGNEKIEKLLFMDEILVLKCGLVVKPKMNNVEGIITAISIRFGRCTYEVSYFYNGDYKVVFLSEEELEIPNAEKEKVGFRVEK